MGIASSGSTQYLLVLQEVVHLISPVQQNHDLTGSPVESESTARPPMVWTARHLQGLCSRIRYMTVGRVTPSKEQRTGKACTRYASLYSQKYSNSGLADKHIWVLLQGGKVQSSGKNIWSANITGRTVQVLYTETTQLEKQEQPRTYFAHTGTDWGYFK